MKTVTVRRLAYLFGCPMVGDAVTLTHQWKTVCVNGDSHLEFQTTKGEWLAEDELIITEAEEFLNTCAHDA